MNFNHFDKQKASLKHKGIVASIYHREFPKGTYEYVVLPDTIRVIPVTKDNHILLIKERIMSMNKYFYSLPGGGVEENETILEASKRELQEETGYTPKKIKKWISINPSQTVVSSKNFVIAYGCEYKQKKNLEKTEDIKVLKVTLDEFIRICLKDDFKYMEIQNIILKLERANKTKEELTKLFKLNA